MVVRFLSVVFGKLQKTEGKMERAMGFEPTTTSLED